MTNMLELCKVRNNVGVHGANCSTIAKRTRLPNSVVSRALERLQDNNMVRYNRPDKKWELAR